MPDRWLSLEELAAFLRLTEKSVLRLRRQGLPMRRVSPRGARGVLESELVMWLKKRPKDGPAVQPAKAKKKRSRLRMAGFVPIP